jgi:hypothetical protein
MVVQVRHRRRAITGVVLLVALVTVAPAAPVAAQDDPPPIDGATLAELRALIPADAPDDVSISAAAKAFDDMLEVVGGTPAGTGGSSSMIGPCGGFAYSYNGDGDLIDAAADFGDAGPPVDLLDGTQAFTSGNRFKVDTGGAVVYYGFAPHAGDGPRDNSWVLKTAGLTLDSGGASNSSGKNHKAGTVDLGDKLPLGFAAKVKVSGELESSNLAGCAGKGYIEFVGGGLGSLIGIGALALTGIGLIGLLLNARPGHKWKAV